MLLGLLSLLLLVVVNTLVEPADVDAVEDEVDMEHADDSDGAGDEGVSTFGKGATAGGGGSGGVGIAVVVVVGGGDGVAVVVVVVGHGGGGGGAADVAAVIVAGCAEVGTAVSEEEDASSLVMDAGGERVGTVMGWVDNKSRTRGRAEASHVSNW